MNIRIEMSMVHNLKFSNTGFDVLGPAWLVPEMFPISDLFEILEYLLQVLLGLRKAALLLIELGFETPVTL